MICYDTEAAFLFQRGNAAGACKAVGEGLFADYYRYFIFGGKAAVKAVAVGVRCDYEDAGFMFGKHEGGIGVRGNFPAGGKKFPPIFIRVGACGKLAVAVCAYCPGVSAGFFTQGIFFKKARDTAEAYNNNFYFVHFSCSLFLFIMTAVQ
jgi:hypothetical protein